MRGYVSFRDMQLLYKEEVGSAGGHAALCLSTEAQMLCPSAGSTRVDVCPLPLFAVLDALGLWLRLAASTDAVSPKNIAVAS